MEEGGKVLRLIIVLHILVESHGYTHSLGQENGVSNVGRTFSPSLLITIKNAFSVKPILSRNKFPFSISRDGVDVKVTKNHRGKITEKRELGTFDQSPSQECVWPKELLCDHYLPERREWTPNHDTTNKLMRQKLRGKRKVTTKAFFPSRSIDDTDEDRGREKQ